MIRESGYRFSEKITLKQGPTGLDNRTTRRRQILAEEGCRTPLPLASGFEQVRSCCLANLCRRVRLKSGSVVVAASDHQVVRPEQHANRLSKFNSVWYCICPHDSLGPKL